MAYYKQYFKNGATLHASQLNYMEDGIKQNADNIAALQSGTTGGTSGGTTIGSTSVSVPSYWQTILDESVETIRTHLKNAGRNKSAFYWYNDSHWDNAGTYNAKVTPSLLKYLCAHTPINKVNFGGDIVSAEGSDSETMAYLWEWRDMLYGLPNHHSVVGNHDDGNSTNNLFSEKYVYAYLQAPEETPDIVRGDNGLWYYIDNPCEKTRYLYLDTAYQGLTTEQTTFVVNALKTTPSGWHIVAISHTWRNANYNTDGTVTVGSFSSDASTLLTMFDNYNARNGEYASCGGKVEFCIGGHTHWDHDSTSTNGIPVILTEADSLNDRSGLDHTRGTTNEAAISAIIADYGANKITVTRIGRGNSRVVSLTGENTGGGSDNPVVNPDVNNLLTTALDNDGNICAWKENTRWSGSSGGEVSSTGTYLSGHFPYTPGQTVYLKNVNLPNVNGSGVIHYYSDLGVRIDGVHINDAVNYWSGVVDDNNMVTQFTMFVNEAYADVKYLRIECLGFDSTSIVTVDVPIE